MYAIRSYYERQAEQFYRKAAKRTTDTDIRKLLGDLAAIEAGHSLLTESLEEEHLDTDNRENEDRASYNFV